MCCLSPGKLIAVKISRDRGFGLPPGRSGPGARHAASALLRYSPIMDGSDHRASGPRTRIATGTYNSRSSGPHRVSNRAVCLRTSSPIASQLQHPGGPSQATIMRVVPVVQVKYMASPLALGPNVPRRCAHVGSGDIEWSGVTSTLAVTFPCRGGSGALRSTTDHPLPTPSSPEKPASIRCSMTL